jgi:hypothetical protein
MEDGMSAPEHSPLPWVVEIIATAGGGQPMTGNVLIRDKQGGLLFERQFYTPLAPLEDIANSRLLVTAVNAHAKLLAAAKWALHDLCTYIDPVSDVTLALQAAIAKAEESAT